MERIRGPKPSSKPGKKRKVANNFSENPHSIKSRKHIEGINNIEKQIERYKNNDQAARTNTIHKLRKTETWQKVSFAEHESLEK
jgi:hypothetical protein